MSPSIFVLFAVALVFGGVAAEEEPTDEGVPSYEQIPYSSFPREICPTENVPITCKPKDNCNNPLMSYDVRASCAASEDIEGIPCSLKDDKGHVYIFAHLTGVYKPSHEKQHFICRNSKWICDVDAPACGGDETLTDAELDLLTYGEDTYFCNNPNFYRVCTPTQETCLCVKSGTWVPVCRLGDGRFIDFDPAHSMRCVPGSDGYPVWKDYNDVEENIRFKVDPSTICRKTATRNAENSVCVAQADTGMGNWVEPKEL